MQGNWTAFSRFERSFGPAAIFYSFLRYSLRWAARFAYQHPVKAQIAYLLGQMNSNELEKLLGHKPTNPLNTPIP